MVDVKQCHIEHRVKRTAFWKNEFELAFSVRSGCSFFPSHRIPSKGLCGTCCAAPEVSAAGGGLLLLRVAVGEHDPILVSDEAGVTKLVRELLAVALDHVAWCQRILADE